MTKMAKLLSVVVALMMLTATLMGCSSTPAASPTAAPSQEAAPEETAAPAEQPAEEAPAQESISLTSAAEGEVPTLKWIVIGGQPKDLDTVTAAWNEYAEAQIGVKAEMTFLDWGVWGDRVTAMINSGEPFDIMFTNGDKYTNAVQMGAFADLTDDIQKVVPDLYSFIPENVWPGVKVKGRIYAVPTYKDSSQTQYWVWDKEMVETLGIDYQNIVTYEQLDPALYQIKDAIAAGTVTGSNYAFPQINTGVNGFLMNFDMPIGNVPIGVRYDDASMTVVDVLSSDEILGNLTYIHKWYQDGVINPDAPTLTEGQKWSPVGCAQGFPGADETWSAGSGRQMVSNPWAGPIYSTGTILGSVNAISSSSKYQVQALKWLQLCNLDTTMRNTIAYGIEGVHYHDNGDGTITRDEVKKDDYAAPAYSQATFFTMSPVSPNKADQWTLVKEWNEKATASVLLGFSFDPTNVTNELANISVVMNRYTSELYTGAVDPAVKVPELYEELNKAGLETVKTELSNQIKAWAASK